MTYQAARILAFVRDWQRRYNCPCPHTALCHDLCLSENMVLRESIELVAAGLVEERDAGPLGGYDLTTHRKTVRP